jgi:DNA-binding MarR family transcriptional regulator
MSEKHLETARTVLDAVPLVMRTLASHMRHSIHALRPAHYGVLIVLAHRPHNLSDLAERMAVSAPTMSNSISILEQHGWVQRVRDGGDRRKVLIALSDEGRHKLADMQAEAISLLADALSPLNLDQCNTLVQGLALLRDCLCRNVGAETLCLSGEALCELPSAERDPSIS